MTAAHVRNLARFATLTVIVAAWLILPPLAIAGVAKAVGL